MGLCRCCQIRTLQAATFPVLVAGDGGAWPDIAASVPGGVVIGIGSHFGNSFLVQHIRRDNRNSPMRPPHVVNLEYRINLRHPIH